MKLQRLVLIFYIWLLAEGVFRKWFFPSYTNILYFIKYFLAVYIYIKLIGIIRQSKEKSIYGEINKPISVFVLFCCISLFYTLVVNNVLVGVLGMMAYLSFIPLTMGLPNILKSEEKISNVLLGIAIISIAIGLLAIVQYNSSPDSFINRYATNSDSDVPIALAGEGENSVVRVTTVFSAHGAYATYATFSFILITPLLLSVKKKILPRLFIFVGFAFSVISLFMTGSRSTVLTCILILMFYLLNKSFQIMRNLKLLISIGSFFLLIVFILLYTEQGNKAFASWNTRYEEGFKNGEYDYRPSNTMKEVYEVLLENPGGLMGFGIGTYQNAANRFNQIKDLPGTEDEVHRIGLELGPIGLIVWYLMVLSVFFYAAHVYKYSRTPLLRDLSLVILLYSFFAVVLMRQIVVNWVDNACWWTCLGILLSIKQIEINKRKSLLKRNYALINNGIELSNG